MFRLKILNRFIKNNYLFQWYLLGFGLFLLAGAIANNFYRNYHSLESQEHSRLLTQSQVINDILGSQLESSDTILTIIRDEIASLHPDAWNGKVSNRRLEVLQRAISGIRTLLIADAAGGIRGANHSRLIGVNIRDRDYFIAAREISDANRLYVSQPYVTSLGAWGITMSRVIQGPGGRFAGIVAATLDPDFFRTIMSSVNYAPDMWVALAHWDGVQFLMVPGDGSLHGRFLGKPGTVFSRHKESGRGLSLITGPVYVTGDERIMAVRNIKPEGVPMDKPLVVAVSRNVGAVVAGWRKDLYTEGGRFLIITFISTLILAFYQKQHRSYMKIERRSQSALKESAERLILATEAAGVGIWEYQLATGQLVWDASMFSIYRLDPARFNARYDDWIGCLDPSDAERVKGEIDRAIAGTGPLETEFRIRCRQGGTRIVRTKAKLSRNGEGNPEKIVGTCEDVTERRKMQRHLLKLTHGIENSASAVMITDVEGAIEYVNRKFTQVTGYSPEEAIGKNPRILKSDSTPSEVFTDLWGTILKGKEWKGELLNRRKNGEVYWSIASISPLRDDNGAITHFIANVEDISERKNAEITIERLAYFDPLTDLPNRRMLKDRLDLAMKRSRRQGGALPSFTLTWTISSM